MQLLYTIISIFTYYTDDQFTHPVQYGTVISLVYINIYLIPDDNDVMMI